MTTDQKLIRTTYFLGLIPLTVGLSIFFTWWIGKAWYLTTFHELEEWGFLWTLISIPLALVGLLTGFIFIFKSLKTNLKKGLFGISCVLINIPVLIWVLNTQHDIEKRAYVRVYNKTESDFKSVTIENSLFKESIHSLNIGDSNTGYFYPNYDELDSSPEIEKVILTIEMKNEQKRIIIPDIYQGDCFRLFIDREFRIEIQ